MSSAGSSLNLCKRCNKNVVNALKCENCLSLYHTSCAKLTNNVKFLCDNKIVCCEVVMDSEADFFDAKEVFSQSDKVDKQIYNYIIYQKDIIIQELRDKINILNTHIDLLNKYMSDFNKNEQKPIEINTSASIKGVKKIPQKILTKNAPVDKNSDIPTVNKKSLCTNNKQNLITNNDVATGLQQVEAQLKMKECIHLTKPDEPITSFLSQKDQEWSQVVKKKRKRPIVIGSNVDNLSVRGVPKFVDLHVYRLDVNTTGAELINFLKPNFPEVKCEALNSKHPELYTSYKVSILQENFKKAMETQYWPKGACIQQFFVLRKKKKEDAV